MADWRPIETAPRDGRNILLASRLADGSTWVIGVGSFRVNVAEFVERGTLFVGWTHWMPLPLPPEGKTP